MLERAFTVLLLSSTLTAAAAHVAPGSDRAVLFGGRPAVTIAASASGPAP
jgi:hypothetical protein